ncbi:hypothetical protein QC764_0049280 [Podospora pseudoanserina]|uniref:Uncharacterized protein n=1 Tax=Podospora pseudoanserina TaxID=2609844 RepID=A0ABR0ICF2_9PEZI|nr:hypothetical protein QC764_0049280 [Podospora pseudoanserina]
MPEDQEGEDEQLMSNLFKSRHPDYASAYWSEQLLSHDNDPRPPPPPATQQRALAASSLSELSVITFEISATTTVGAGVLPTPLQFQAD